MSAPTRYNFLFVMVDELMAAPVYETEEIKKWRNENLHAQKFLRENCMEFLNHYIGATACSPSRTTLFTGQYPTLHGVTQTGGIAKSSSDPEITWLDSNTIPTMGQYFEKSGYKTWYKGKWHISEADIRIPGTRKAVPTFDQTTGELHHDNIELYKHSDRLKDYGFSGWIGPEPHGANPNNSASSSAVCFGGRDVCYADQVIELIDQVTTDSDDKPWLIVASMVNPHDIVLFGDYSQNLPILNFCIDPSLPDIPAPPTESDDLSTKPSVQESYRQTYPKALQPISDRETYRKFYYSLQKYVDDQINRILTKLKSTSAYENTIVIFTSDHGDQLGAHNLHQKWYNVYEETIHVPFIIHNPILFNGYNTSDQLTSHVDIIPTMLELAGINQSSILDKLKKDHFEVRPLVGKRMNLGIDNYIADNIRDPVYFWTVDNPMKGTEAINLFTQLKYEPVAKPNCVEAVIAYIRTKVHPEKQLYKYARYYDPLSNDPSTEEYELYNLTQDPTEMNNIAHGNKITPVNAFIKATMQSILVEQRERKALKPKYVSSNVIVLPNRDF